MIEVPGYRLAETLVHGRRGPLRAGVRVDNDQRVVVHLIDKRLDWSGRQRLGDRAQQVRILTPDPTLVPLLDAGVTSEGWIYLVTPRLERSLADELAAVGPLPLDLVVSAGRAVLSALSLLHEQGVMHGNITPGNLLLRADGGIALTGPRFDVLDEVTATGPVVHSPPKAAGAGPWTASADVYMLGSVLWTLLSGWPPYRDPQDHAEQRLPPLSRDDIPDGLATLVRRMLAPLLAERPADIAGLAGELDSLPRGGAVPGRPPESGRSRASGRREGLTGSRPAAESRVIGRYRLQTQLGAGGNGVVWRAVDELGRPVAVKELRPELHARGNAARRFRQEFGLLAELTHAHLVPALDIVAEDECTALVMPLCGHDLRTFVTNIPMATSWYIAVLRQLASALAYLHQQRVVHRDVKPENLLLERDDPPMLRLADLGIAKILDLTGMTTSGRQPGTVPYMAPEQLEGHIPATPAVDVYAFGVVMYEMLAGRLPFRGVLDDGVQSHVNTEPERPLHVSDEAWALLTRCLNKESAGRPAAGDLRELLWALPESRLDTVPRWTTSTGSTASSPFEDRSDQSQAVPGFQGASTLRSSSPPFPAPVVRPPQADSRPPDVSVSGPVRVMPDPPPVPPPSDGEPAPTPPRSRPGPSTAGSEEVVRPFPSFRMIMLRFVVAALLGLVAGAVVAVIETRGGSAVDGAASPRDLASPVEAVTERAVRSPAASGPRGRGWW
ncbi:protein kinase domain-containing protein [Parafrankia sp. FMc2]|uniref:protein kinase domain-containing protein n=1 Tax=Parafrankia sp. FMc2 TaxID=3233196 RepID=UPI0034D66D94